ncbi:MULTISPECIES: hypothetical protein [Bradyrhizobium]|uniref:hypothetical protein n=1 Tax=Bradyrhizobium embrapense TaxID=630921 RepID=UPI0012F4D505|nr:hypothetical protein [Bradyrhizobium embrapense]
MRTNFTLPELEQELRRLHDGAVHHLTRHDYRRLFGDNDVAVARLRNFAKSHGCVASFADEQILLRKLLRRVEGSASAK